MRIIILLFSFILIFSTVFFAQNAVIKGNIQDENSGETLPGVKINIVGTSIFALSDINGDFSLSNIDTGTYTLVFKYETYQTKNITEVIVKENQPTILNVSLSPSVLDVGTVTVTATINKESASNVISLQKNNAGMVDGISAESIKKSPDRNTSDVLKRVSGASIQDNKFVIIRGLNDRYNTSLINGLPLPSSESDRKAFSFDLFPSIMLDNILISKTASPDLPGDFAGGVIQITTKDIPDKDFFSFSIGGNSNSQSVFKSYKTYDGSKNDYLGLGSSDRSLSNEIPDSKTFKAQLSNVTTRFESSNLFKNDWAIQDKNNSPIGQNYQMAFAKTLKIAKNELGVVGALSYNYSRRYQDIKRRDFNDDGSILFDYSDNTYRENVFWGAMLNIAYKIGANHKLSLKNMYSVNAEDAVIERKGQNLELEQEIYATSMQYNSNKILTSQLSGEHSLPKSKIKIKWGANYNDISRSIPNLRRMYYYKNSVSQGSKTDSIFTAYVPFGVPSPNYAGKFYSDLSEKLYTGMFEIAIPFKFLDENNTLKLGGASSIKDRSFDARVFGYAINNPATFDYDLLYQTQDMIFDERNINAKGFKLGELTNPSDSYIAHSDLHAGYIMVDQKIKSRIRLVYGLRLESFTQKLNSLSYGGTPIQVNNKQLDYLPSINFTFAATEKSNIRFAASKTVSRPDFRELAPFSFYDFNTSSAVIGNDSLKTANITNFDIRYELFPGLGQMISASVFYKDFKNPIENTVNFGGAGSRTYSYQNVDRAKDFGFEAEFRMKLQALDSTFHTKFFKDITFFTNLTLIKSEVDLSKVANAVTKEEKYRPMQGQSPYIINSGLQYLHAKSGIGVSILYNKIGRRIWMVGTNGYLNIYEAPRNIVDFQISKLIDKKGEIKININDIFNQSANFYQDQNRSKKYEADADSKIIGIKYGINYSISFSYKF